MLQYENINLRVVNDDDKEALGFSANNKKVWDNVPDMLQHPYTMEDAVSFINSTKNEKPQISFAIESDGAFCGGMIVLVPQQDVYRKTAVEPIRVFDNSTS